MPRKPQIDKRAKKDLTDHLAAVEQSMFALRFRLMHYFAGREEIRARYEGIERIFKSYSKDCRREVEQRIDEEKA